MKFGGLKKNFPEIMAIATFDAKLSDEAEVVLGEDLVTPEVIAPTGVSVTEATEAEKDRAIADLQAALNDTNRRLAELVGKDNQRTDITINVERANVAKANNPLLKAFRRLRCK